MTYQVYHSATFEEDLKDFPSEYRQWLDAVEDQLVINPYAGDPLRFRWCREKKRGPYRIYYLIYEHLQTVLLVRISDKNNQRKVINIIFSALDLYKNEIENLLRNR